MTRNEAFLYIITQLNNQHRQGEVGIFNCGSLGFVHIWFHHSWGHRWFNPSEEFLGAVTEEVDLAALEAKGGARCRQLA